MKISHRLIALTGFTSAGLVAVAAVGYLAVTSIQGDLRSLTLEATPLQNRTYELQERTERAMGALLRLSLARSADEAGRGQAGFDAEMKELDRLVAETDLVGNRFRLTPLKERLKASLDGVARLGGDAAQAELLKEVKTVAGAVGESFTKEGSGLFALRADVLSGKEEQDSAYQAQRKALLKQIDDENGKLGAAVDTLEVQAVKQRQVLEAALKFRNEPGGVVAASDAISLDRR